MQENPISEVQTQFLLSSLLHPGTGLNTITRAFRIEGLLDSTLLSDALSRIQPEFSALGSLVAVGDDGNPVSSDIKKTTGDSFVTVVSAPDGFDTLEHEVNALRRLLSPETQPWGIRLLRHAEMSHTLIFCVHRALLDEESLGMVIRSVSGHYSGGTGTFPKPLAFPAGTDSGKGGQRFADTLAGIPPVHGFPLDNARPSFFPVETRSINVRLGNDTSENLKSMGDRLGIDPFLVQAFGVACVLGGYCGQERVSLGLPFPLTPGAPGDVPVGCNTALLPVGIAVKGSGSFGEMARSFAETYESLLPLGNTPFSAIAGKCGTHIDPTANPLFQVALERKPSIQLDLVGCECAELTVSMPPQQLDLFIQLAPDSVTVAYASAIISSETAGSFASSVVEFLTAAVREPWQELRALPLQCSVERKAFLDGVNRTSAPEFLERDVYELLTGRFAAFKDKTAVLSGGTSLKYAELENLTLAISEKLLEAGVITGDLVGISLRRSVDLPAAMLAVLRLGCAYVPLDPSFPADRLAYMAEHSGLTCVIASSSLRLPYLKPGVKILELDRVMPVVAPSASPARVLPESAAYVIYTSGSTGKPKGVAVPRIALANFLSSMVASPGIDPDAVLCAVTTLSFDIAELELLGPLCAGATVAIATEEESKDPRLLVRLLESSGATILQATPVTWQMLLASGWKGNPNLKALCGGEALTQSLASALVPKTASLWNMYGPTETTVWSTCTLISRADSPISVGKPIANTTIYVLDELLRPVPAGVEGTLFIGGAGVATGYLHDPDLTARKFLHDSVSGAGRMYDTGDRARFDREGRLFITGRTDFQVKIRGYRIELGEIEARLLEYPGIVQSVVVARTDDPSNPELVAYYVLAREANEPTVAVLREHCASALPPYMIPGRFMALEDLPQTPNGKVDRKALPMLAGPGATEGKLAGAMVPRSGLEATITEILREILGVASVGLNDSFFELGGTSITALAVAQRISQKMGIDFSILGVFEHPTVKALANFLEKQKDNAALVSDAGSRARARRAAAASTTAFDVAIIGAAGRFPGAQNLKEFWSILSEGRETVTFWDRNELDALVPERDRDDPAYVPARGVLSDIDKFDGAFFGISPNEAELMDPQQRVFLEVAWEAFENSGYVGEAMDGPVGVWAAKGNDFYYVYNVLTRPDKIAIMGEIAAEIANEKDHIAPRVSHKLNLTGPSLSVHTACSSTLVVVENAYQALVSGQVDVALAGGIDIRTPQKSGQRYEEGGVFSIDGHCRPFDAGATGTMFGEAAGAIVMKRMDDALRDGDNVLAVIKGAAVNHDGGKKVSYVAPSVEGQVRVISSALALAGVNPDTITFLEAHGTATPIGDPIEVEALTRVFSAYTKRKGYCAIGSVKSNFGHATTAAGIVGILKIILAMQNRKIPGTLHYTIPNPRIDFRNSPFFVNKELIDWSPVGLPRRAGISSFGFCGTNAHIILEEAPAPVPSSEPGRPLQLFLLSARSSQALEESAIALSKSLENADSCALADAAYTLQVGRKRFEFRRCAVASTCQEATAVLTQPSGQSTSSLNSEAESPPVAFMFPGQGAQYINMGSALYRSEPIFRETVDHCVALLEPHLGCDLRKFLFPDPADDATARESLNNTFYTQPAIFTISYALATLLRSFGIEPSCYIGHSIGEFVAATLSGVMALDDALKLVATRGKLMQSLPRGSMLSVRLPEEKVREMLPPGIDIATVNSPKLCVVAGPTELISDFTARLEASNVGCRALHTSHAFHSSMMDPIVGIFRETVAGVRLMPPTIPFVSTVTGNWISPEEATDPGYWAAHLRSPVLFSKAISVLMEDSRLVLIECGPRRTSASLALQHMPKNPGRILATMPDSAEVRDEYPSLLLAIGGAWLNGCDIDWDAFHSGENRRRIGLPTYPFQRRRYWIEPGDVSAFGLGSGGLNPAGTVPAVPEEACEREGAAATARDGVMSVLISIIEQALGTKLPDFDENARFIELGFDSLLITQLARIVRQRLGFDVTFRQLSETYPTAGSLAAAIRKSNANKTTAPTPVSAVPETRQNAPAAPLANTGAISGARLGRDENGKPAWFVPDPERPGKFRKVETHE